MSQPKPPAQMSAQELAEASARALWEGDQTSQSLGMELERIAPGEALVSMRLTPAMSNGHGTCHGGHIFTLADSAFAFAANTYNQSTVAQHCSITFLNPAMVGDRLTASAKEIARRGRSGIYDIRITNQDGTLIAEFRGHSRTLKGTLI